MRLIESYLSEVGRFLPASQRGDILSELRVSLEEQVLEIAGDSTPAVEDEKAVINRLGHPLQVASGFQGQRYLIGPELFPSFVMTIKSVLILVALIQVALMLTAFVTSGWVTSPFSLAAGLFDTLFWAAAVVFGIFAIIEYSGDRLNWYNGWTADSLKSGTGAPVKNGQMISNLISEGVFLLWWNDVLILQNWIPGAREIFNVELADVWTTLYWPLNLLFGGWFLLHAYVLFRGLWQPAAAYAEIALAAVCIALGAWLLSHSPLVLVSGDIGEGGELIASRVTVSVIIVVMALTAWDGFLALRRLRQSYLPAVG